VLPHLNMSELSNMKHTSCSYDLQIVWALAVDSDAVLILEMFQKFNFSFKNLNAKRDIYSPAFQLVFPHLSPEANRKNLLKRFNILVQILEHKEADYSIAFHLVNEHGYDLYKDVLAKYLFHSSEYDYFLHSLKVILKQHHYNLHVHPNSIEIQLLKIASCKRYRFGIRSFVDCLEKAFGQCLLFLIFNSNHFFTWHAKSILCISKNDLRKRISKVKQCFMLYSTLVATHKIIQTRVISKLKYNIDGEAKYIDPNVATIIASFLSLVPYHNPHTLIMFA
jgi:hypothetical protein